MERRAFGRSGLSFGAVGLGTWKVFDVTSPREKAACRRVVDEALNAGSNLFDSSPMYGHSEHVLAECLMGRREDAVVATKVWATSEDQARSQVRDALTFFGGHVDLYQVHNLSLTAKVLDILEAARRDGKVGAIGATHYQPSAFGELLTWMESGRLDAVQVPYSVGERTVEREVLPAAKKLGLGVLVMLPFEQGALTRSPPPPPALKAFERFGCKTWPHVLLKWILSDPRVTAAIPATRSAAHMAENAPAGSPPWFDEDARGRVVALAKAAGLTG
jgi:aryl-alcohol dehydrogenase-like predicted oxidoreductase